MSLYTSFQSSEMKLRKMKKMLIDVLSKAELHDSFTLLSLSQETMDWWIQRKKMEKTAIKKRERRVELSRLRTKAKNKLKDFLDRADPEERKLLKRYIRLKDIDRI